jgi:CheY-like chemotaxis protein
MSTDFQKRMYFPFEQDCLTARTETQGTGLGLYIAKKFIDAMEGTIECQSIVNGGTTFVVKLEFSLADEGQEDSAPDETQIRAALAGKRILICEDQKINAEIAKQMLERIGMICETAADGRQGVQKFNASIPGYYAAILMDIRMPVLNGYEASVAIRAEKRPDSAKIPIIAMTADAFTDGRVDCRNAGINDCIYKPVDMMKLYIMVYQWIINPEKQTDADSKTE